MQKNILFILLDSLRYDLVAQPQARRALMPVLDKLVEAGTLSPVNTNGHTTKFAIPALFSLCYPLDHGGYNYGLRDRPHTIVELIRDAGLKTHLFVAHDLDGPTGRIERGGDHVEMIYDRSQPIYAYLRHVFSHEIDLAARGVRSEDEILQLLRRDLDELLAYVADGPYRAPGRWPRCLYRPTAGFVRHIEAERRLLAEEPETVLRKIRTIPLEYYTSLLGRRRPGLALRVRMLGAAVLGRVQKFLTRRFGFPLQLLHPRVPARACEVFSRARHGLQHPRQPWFAYIHVMDIHDSRVLRRPWFYLRRLARLPHVLRARRATGGDRKWYYDLAAHQIDCELGQFLEASRRDGKLENTTIVVTADHGNGWDPVRPHALQNEFGLRHYHEHLEVPLIIVNGPAARPAAGLIDTMGVGATLVDLAGGELPSGTKGVSALAGGKAMVITESAGRGNSDLTNSDLFFTITSATHKLMTRLHGDRLEQVRLFDRKTDPHETRDRLDDPALHGVREALLAHLYAGRGDLLRARGIEPEPRAAAAKTAS